jgi:RNA polymerase sigma-70 factor (ECF subfamily)
MVYRRCLSLLRNHELAQEATQEVFLKILARTDTLDLGQGPSSLLYITAINTCLNMIRSAKRRPETLDDELLLCIVDCETVERSSVLGLFARQILADESASTQAMAIMHYLDGMTYEELAAQFNLSVSGVRKRLRVFKDKVTGKGEHHELG